MEKSEYIKIQEESSAWTSESKVLNFHTGKVEPWSAKVDNYFQKFAQLISEHLYDDDVVADIGCGDGSALFKFSRSNICTPIGIDISKEKLSFCNQHFKNIETVNCFVEDIPLPKKSIDYVFCSHTLEHSYDLDKALKEINRVTKKFVFFAVPLESDNMAALNVSHYSFNEDKNWWLDKYKKAGFKEVNHVRLLSHTILLRSKRKPENTRIKKGYDLVYWGLPS